jgi:DNA-binding transcriptional MerR regulator
MGKYTTAELADRFNVTVYTIAAWLRGKRLREPVRNKYGNREWSEKDAEAVQRLAEQYHARRADLASRGREPQGAA